MQGTILALAAAILGQVADLLDTLICNHGCGDPFSLAQECE